MGTKKFLGRLLFPFALTLLAGTFVITHPARSSTSKEISPMWTKSLRKRLSELESKYPDSIGIYVKDLGTGEEFSYRGEESWYVASGVKVPIAIEVMRQIEQGNFSLDSKVKITENDYVDGAGETNSQKPGSLVTLRYLLEQMLVHSDNTASDLLIQQVGLGQVNQLVKNLAPEGFNEITKLSDVRRYAFSGFHPDATKLANKDFIRLKSIGDEKKKIRELATLLKIKISELRARNLDDSYNAYYAKRLNSATLQSYARILEELVGGRAANSSSTEFLMNTLERVQTGQKRIKAGLPPSFVFAHKTGTQHARICDFGIAWNGQVANSNKVIIAACSRGISSLSKSEMALKEVGDAIYSSGVFNSML